MQKVYFSEATGKTIVDVSGKKPLGQIKKEFGDTAYVCEELEPLDGESILIQNGLLLICDRLGKTKPKK